MHIRHARLTTAGALLASAVLLTAGPATAAPAALAPPGVFNCNWGGFQPPPPDSDQDSILLHGVAAVSPCDVWAVGGAEGATDSGVDGPVTPVIDHWTGGNSWTTVPGPPADDGSKLLSVSAASASDVWAVGLTGRDPDTGDRHGLMDHWDGTSWNAVDLPAGVTELLSVSADSASDAWAAGDGSANGNGPFVLRWDGSSWTVADVPGSGAASVTVVSAVGPGNVWAVGTATDPSGQNRAVAWHWDGSSWAESSLDPAVTVTSVVALPGGGAYVIGYAEATPPSFVPYVAQWNGSSFSPVSLPPSGTSGAGSVLILSSAAASSASDVWAAGAASHGGTAESVAMLHWDGSAWKWITAPFADGHGADAVAVASPGSAWAVGGTNNNAFPYAAPAPVVPTLQGLSPAAAQGALTSAGLRSGNVTPTGQCAASSNGDITAASPGEGTQATYGTAVNLTECVWIAVPNVQGFDDGSAQHAITSTGLTVGTVSQTSNQCLGPAGEVITQTPMAGQSAALGSSVSLTESSGRNTAGKPCGTGGGSPK